MDRFFSKLDLRDIKIDPFNTSFPPDDEDDPATGALADADPAPPRHQGNGTHEPTASEPSGWPGRSRHVPAWAVQDAASVAEVAVGETVEVAATTTVAAAAVAVAEAPVVAGYANGHAALASPDVDLLGAGDMLKVSARSRPSAVAGAIAGVVREHGRAEVQAIGAGATNQAIKAVAIARDYLRETGIEAVCLPAFIDVTIENEDRTAIRLVIEPR